MALEKHIQSKILKYLNSLDGCRAENVSGSMFQKNRPDINCCYKGKCYRLEVKSADNNNKATKSQLLNLKKWRESGAICEVVYSLEETIKLLEDNS